MRRDLTERNTQFNAVPPGETLKQLAADRRLSDGEMASELGISPEDLTRVYTGRIPINERLAELMEEAGFVSKEFWLEREEEYEQEIRKEKIEHISSIFNCKKKKR